MRSRPLRKRLIVGGIVAGVIAFAWLMLRPTPVPVEFGKVVRGPMIVTVDEDGETRAHDRFVVAAPIPGRMLRVTLEDGDLVRVNQVVAAIEPLPLNQQQREEVLARVETAEASKLEADARAEHAREDHEQAKRDLQRAEEMDRHHIISQQDLERAQIAEATAAQELEAAKFSALAAAAEVKVARAGLISMEPGAAQHNVVALRSPIAGRVLRVVEKSERVVQSGTPLAILGDPAKIEVVTDVLTTDAVSVQPGAEVFLTGWGGNHPLRAKVRLVEPSGFTKISALGVEEKRVNVISDFVDSPEGLADGYRVDCSIVTWAGSDVLQAPISAVFRQAEGWSVFVVEAGRARLRSVKIGHRNQNEAEILSGLSAGDHVIVHPSNQLRDGSLVKGASYD